MRGIYYPVYYGLGLSVIFSGRIIMRFGFLLVFFVVLLVPFRVLAEGFQCAPVAEIPLSEVTLIGEIHGTNEIPALAVEHACVLAKSGRQVIFVLEFPRSEQVAVEQFLASEGKRADREKLISSSFWQSERLMDGRASVAMLDLLMRVRYLRVQGAKINVLLDDGFWDEDRDMAMAQTILAEKAKSPDAVVVGLFGSFHSSESPGRERYPYQAIGYRLRELEPLTVYVNFTGWAWGCATSACGVIRVGVVKPDAVFFKYIPGDEDGIDHAHDGVVNLPKITASPPARYLVNSY